MFLLATAVSTWRSERAARYLSCECALVGQDHVGTMQTERYNPKGSIEP